VDTVDGVDLVDGMDLVDTLLRPVVKTHDFARSFRLPGASSRKPGG
jgi:hypothetical protein